MAGLAFYNSFIPSTNFHFVLAPMYSFQTEQINGIGNLQYFIYPKNSFIKSIELNSTSATLSRSDKLIIGTNETMIITFV